MVTKKLKKGTHLWDAVNGQEVVYIGSDDPVVLETESLPQTDDRLLLVHPVGLEDFAYQLSETAFEDEQPVQQEPPS